MDEIAFSIYQEYIQSFVESNLGRNLTPVEMKRMPCALFENGMAEQGLLNAIYLAAKDAMDNENDRWNSYDKHPIDM